MAHFAKLDENNIVLEVNVVNNDVLDLNNQEESGIAFLTEWSGGHANWRQTSYNANFRKNFAGIGHTYDETRNAFIPIKPYPSWILDEETCNWKAPIPKPTEGRWYWDEPTLTWIEIIIS